MRDENRRFIPPCSSDNSTSSVARPHRQHSRVSRLRLNRKGAGRYITEAPPASLGLSYEPRTLALRRVCQVEREDLGQAGRLSLCQQRHCNREEVDHQLAWYHSVWRPGVPCLTGRSAFVFLPIGAEMGSTPGSGSRPETLGATPPQKHSPRMGDTLPSLPWIARRPRRLAR